MSLTNFVTTNSLKRRAKPSFLKLVYRPWRLVLSCFQADSFSQDGQPTPGEAFDSTSLERQVSNSSQVPVDRTMHWHYLGGYWLLHHLPGGFELPG